MISSRCWSTAFAAALLLGLCLPGCNGGGSSPPGDQGPHQKVAGKPAEATLDPPAPKSTTPRPADAPIVGAANPPEDKAPDDKSPEQTSPRPQASVVVETARPSGAGILAVDPLDSESPEVPPVMMSQQHAATCLVKVGDPLPVAQLADLQDRQQDLAKLFGERLTILFFFSSENPQSLTELTDMASQVASHLSPRGVQVVGICHRDLAATAKAACQQAGASFPVLLDTDGAYLARLATTKLPRTYLLDAEGKVLWLDIEYTHPTRHDLREALRALLSE